MRLTQCRPVWRFALALGTMTCALFCGSGVALAATPLQIGPFVQQGKLTPSEGVIDGHFGQSVALSGSGDVALIGQPSASGGAGAAWIFARSGDTWTQGPKLTASGEVGRGEFGASVALSADGNVALIGSPKDNGGVGAVWVFTRSGETWTQQGAKVTASDEVGEGEFGESVALSRKGDVALIGGPGDNGTVGAAWLFRREGQSWVQRGEKLTSGEEILQGAFGWSVAISADGATGLIGEPGGVLPDYQRHHGAAWIFTGLSGIKRLGEKLAVGEELHCYEETYGPTRGFIGLSVALSADGRTALVGGPGYPAEHFEPGPPGEPTRGSYFCAFGFTNGAAWAFTRSGSTWTQQGERLKGAFQARSGWSVALSGDGNVALLGGPEAVGPGPFSGVASLFVRSGSSWSAEQIRGDAVGPFAGFGTSVALSSSGLTALIGGPGTREGDIKLETGAAWVFTSPESP